MTTKTMIGPLMGRILATTALVSAGIWMAQPSHAQDADGAWLPEEIIVTAQKREARLQDVPIAVSAVDGAALEFRGITDFRDVLRSIPGISYSGETRGQSNYSIRGISTEAFSPTVGVYLDDISLVTISTNFTGAAEPAFFDLERVEVLKGPQGTLYGGNAMGGAIKYITRKPDPSAFSGSASAGLGFVKDGDMSFRGDAVLNFPIVADEFAIRAGVQVIHEGGYIDNIANGNVAIVSQSTTFPPNLTPLTQPSLSDRAEDDHDTSLLVAFKGQALWQVNDDWQVIASASYQDYELENANEYWNALDGFQSSYRLEEPTSDNLGVYSLSISGTLGDFDFVSLTGYVDREIDWERDYTFFVASLVPPLFASDTDNISSTTTETITQEFRLSYDQPDSRLRWVAGLFYSYQEDELDQDVNSDGAGAFFGTGTDIVYQGVHENEGREFAAFGEATYSLTDWLDLTAGFRYFRNRQQLNFAADGVFNGGPTSIDDEELKEDGFNPKISLAAQVAEDSLLFVTASKGYRAGGPNRFVVASALCADDLARLGLTTAPSSYESDSIWSYEIGTKNQFFDRRLTVNASAYYSDWKNIQQQVNLVSCGFQFTDNVGEAEVYGGELEARADLPSGTTLGVALAYTDTEITESVTGVSAQPGQSVLNVPEWTASLYGEQRFQAWQNYEGIVRLEWQYRGDALRQFEDTIEVGLPDGTNVQAPNPAQDQESYSVLNFSATLQSDSYQFQLFVNNLTNNDPILNRTVSLGIDQVSTLRPRTIGVRARMNF